MDSQDRLIALDDTMDSETLQHYGVKGMKWGIRRARKKLEKPTKKTQKISEDIRDVEKATAILKKHKTKVEDKISKLEKQNIKYQSVYEKRVTRDAEKSAKLETKSAKLKRKASGRFITDGRAKELMFEAQKLDAKVSTLDARVKSAKAKIEKNKVMMETFQKGLNEIDDLLIKAKRDGQRYDLKKTRSEALEEGFNNIATDYGKHADKAKTESERQAILRAAADEQSKMLNQINDAYQKYMNDLEKAWAEEDKKRKGGN